jgi:hypothetical protein
MLESKYSKENGKQTTEPEAYLLRLAIKGRMKSHSKLKDL